MSAVFKHVQSLNMCNLYNHAQSLNMCICESLKRCLQIFKHMHIYIYIIYICICLNDVLQQLRFAQVVLYKALAFRSILTDAAEVL